MGFFCPPYSSLPDRSKKTETGMGQTHKPQTPPFTNSENTPQIQSPLLTYNEAAKYIRKSYSTLRIWIHKGIGPPHVKLPGKTGNVFFRLADLNAWIESRLVDKKEMGSHASFSPPRKGRPSKVERKRREAEGGAR